MAQVRGYMGDAPIVSYVLLKMCEASARIVVVEHDSFAICQFWPFLFDCFLQFHKFLAVNI